MFQRQIPLAAVKTVLSDGEVIDSQLEDQPYPSYLLLGWYDGSPFHLVVSRNPETMDCHVVTVYRPDPAIWQSDFRRRR